MSMAHIGPNDSIIELKIKINGDKEELPNLL